MSFVAEEENIIKVIKELKGVSLIPTFREYIKADLASNSKVETEVGKFPFNSSLKSFQHFASLVKLSKFLSFLSRTVSTDRRDVNQSSSEFYKGTSFNRNIEVGNILQNKVDEFLQFLLP